MSKLLALAFLLAAVGLGAWLGSGTAAGGAESLSGRTFEVRLGDRVRVVGAPLGCRVARVPALGGRVALDCRRAGPLVGTYGTLVTAREAATIRFTSRRAARVVFVAKHDGEARRCG